MEVLTSPTAPSAVWVAAEALLGPPIQNSPHAFGGAQRAASMVSSAVISGLKLLTQVQPFPNPFPRAQSSPCFKQNRGLMTG